MQLGWIHIRNNELGGKVPWESFAAAGAFFSIRWVCSCLRKKTSGELVAGANLMFLELLGNQFEGVIPDQASLVFVTITTVLCISRLADYRDKSWQEGNGSDIQCA